MRFEASTETTASPAAVWAVWSDLSRWPEFDPGIESIELEGGFVAGAKGRLKPKGAPFTSRIEIVDAKPQQSFVSTGSLPLAQLRYEHELSDVGSGRTRITHRGQLTGPLSALWARVLGDLAKDEQTVVNNIARLAEASP